MGPDCPEALTKGQRVKQVKLVVGGVRGVTCDGPGIPETGRSGDSLQGDDREGEGFVFSFFMKHLNQARVWCFLCLDVRGNSIP